MVGKKLYGTIRLMVKTEMHKSHEIFLKKFFTIVSVPSSNPHFASLINSPHFICTFAN